jgi:hypothetical protein
LKINGADAIPSEYGVEYARRVASQQYALALPIVPAFVDLVVETEFEIPIFIIVAPAKLEIL